jgi:GTP-binding protein
MNLIFFPFKSRSNTLQYPPLIYTLESETPIIIPKISIIGEILFIDEAQIYVKAGNGGHGCVSFRREKFIAKGGPDGGDGGFGGSIYLEAAGDVDTLIDFASKHHWKAKNGLPGEGDQKSGLSGDDLIVRVPVGTIIHDTDFDLILKDLDKVGMKVCICRGGLGGRGNKTFASSVRQTPKFATDGKIGQERNIRLELKLIADVGLVGMPNAGKSTLVSRCSAARPKIANYPFTTLSPVLGIVELTNYRRFVMADIPGLIEGAHDGAGLGHEFLRHIERTRIILHVLDICPTDNSDPVENYHKIRQELKLHSEVLGDKDEVVVLNKTDLDPDGDYTADISERLGIKDALAISAVTGEGLTELNEKLWGIIKGRDDDESDSY